MGRKRKDRVGYNKPDDPLTKALERPEVQEAPMRGVDAQDVVANASGARA